MSNSDLLLLGMAILAAGAAASLLVARSRKASGWVSFVFVLAASAVFWRVAVNLFTLEREADVSWLELGLLGARLTIGPDPLSALFLVIVATLAPLSTLFSIDYMTMRHYQSDSVAKFYPVLLVFFISMVGVLIVSDFLFFLVFWELMTLSSFFLVIYERENPVSQRAGLKYFIITHVATLCMVAAALVIWTTSESFDFTAMRDTLGSLLTEQPALGHLVILLLALGFATKAGVLPMGDWLPDAHPVAPSGMSAVLSGALVKLGIYGLLRLFLTLVPVSEEVQVWGMVIAFFGTASSLVGNITALGQIDSKRLMAFSTIGQIGYICLGLGVGIYCLPDQPVLATLGFMGCLFHTVNHACFKSCLFLGAGSVLYRTGEKRMDQLGGLGQSMPITAGTSIIASLSIAGIPPLNGFASKWLILVTCLVVGLSSPFFLVLGLIGLVVSLASLAAFLKVLGSVFFGIPRPDLSVREVPISMVAPQVVLAAFCVLIGAFPWFVLRIVHGALASLPSISVPSLTALMGGTSGMILLINGEGVAFFNPIIVLLGLFFLSLLGFAIQRSASAEVRQVPVWACGEEHSAELLRYRASSFYLPFKRAFEGLYPDFTLKAPAFPAWLRRAFELDGWLYNPVVRWVDRLVVKVSASHSGIPQVYLLWTVIGAAAVGWIMLSFMT
jgi:hydrogenase-4 component B